MARFRAALTRLCGEKHIPPGLVGDLSDLQFALEALSRRLRDFAFQTEPKWKQRRRQFHELEITLAEDLGMTLDYLLPAMKKVRRRLYRMKSRPKSKHPPDKPRPTGSKPKGKRKSSRPTAGVGRKRLKAGAAR
jgi:hypothetical protein